MALLTKTPGGRQTDTPFDPLSIQDSRAIAEHFRSKLKDYYKKDKALLPEIKRKIDAFCDWLAKKDAGWARREIAGALAGKKLEIADSAIGTDEALAGYLAMRYLFDAKAIPGLKQNYPALIIGSNGSSAGGYYPESHTIRLAGSSFLPYLKESPDGKRIGNKFGSETDEMIAIFNVSLHESAHSFRIAHGLPGPVNEIGTYLAQSNLGLPFKLKGEIYDFVFGQRYVPHSLQQAKDSSQAAGGNAYFQREYEEYLVGPYLEKYYEGKKTPCPEFYEYWKNYAYSPGMEKPPSPAGAKSPAGMIKAALESLLKTKLGDAIETHASSFGIPDEGFKDLLKKAMFDIIKERLGAKDNDSAAILEMTLEEASEKCRARLGAKKIESPSDVIPPLYQVLEKMMGKPAGRKIPDGFGYAPRKNETDFFA